MDTIKKIAVDLVLNHNIKHSEINLEISKAILEESNKLPKIRVLYCETYGGYGYSKEFLKYKGTDDDEDRVNDLPLIVSFGIKMINQYPEIASMIRKYVFYDLKHIFDKASSYKFKLEKIKDELLTKNIIIDKILDSYAIEKKFDYSFNEAVKKLNSIDIWKYQPYFDYNIMVFLNKYPELLQSDTDINIIDINETMGLLFANGDHCKLKICEVPQLINWTVSEYDGFESIIY